MSAKINTEQPENKIKFTDRVKALPRWVKGLIIGVVITAVVGAIIGVVVKFVIMKPKIRSTDAPVFNDNAESNTYYNQYDTPSTENKEKFTDMYNDGNQNANNIEDQFLKSYIDNSI